MRRIFGQTIALLLAGATVVAQVPVPANGCYHSAFTPNNPSMGTYGHDDFETLARKNIAIEMFYTGWPVNRTPDFPKSQCDAIVQKGALPHITWEPWVNGYPYPLDAIITGTYDAYIVGYATAVKNWAKPLFIRLGHEMNGNWYPWGGINNGGGTLNGYGDATVPDGPERFIAAYRRVHRLFDSVGVKNVSWIWCPNNGSVPGESWNQPDSYYPGDDVVDWIGLDGYNWGTSLAGQGWASFYDIFKELYNKYKSSPKPLMIAEFASTELGGDKGKWIRDAYLYNKLLFPRVKAITWFHINKETDWRINSTGNALSGYQDAVADPYYLSEIVTTAVEEQPQTVPSTFSVESAYPNPFNGGVTIRYTAAPGAPVHVRILSMLGEQVYYTTVYGSGTGTPFFWDGTTGSGRAVASGLYLAVFQTAALSRTQKLLYLK